MHLDIIFYLIEKNTQWNKFYLVQKKTIKIQNGNPIFIFCFIFKISGKFGWLFRLVG